MESVKDGFGIKWGQSFTDKDFGKISERRLQLDVSERYRAPWMRNLTYDLIGAERLVSTIKTYTRRR